ncbi:MAG: stage II sporulation protein M [Cuniculiplasma sp.]
MRTKNLINYSKEDTRMSHTKRFVIKLKHAALRSIFLTIPFFPFFDNILAKKGLKFTDRYLGIAVVYPLRIKKIKIKGVLNRNTNQTISKITPKMISYLDFLEYYSLQSTRDNLELRGGKRGRNRGKNWPGVFPNSTPHFDRISKVVNSREFFLSGLEDNRGKASDSEIHSFYKIQKRYSLDYFYVACLFYFIPLIVAILVGWHITNGNTFYTPAPLISNRYVSHNSLSQVQQDIFNQNFTIDLHYLILGGITLFFLPYLGIYSSVYLPSLEMASSLHSQYWYYLIYAVFPHFFIETFGYVFGVISGLYLSKLLIEIATSYSHGVDINVFLKHIYFNLWRFTLMIVLSVALILFASYIEAYVTSFILNHFYFIHTKYL